MISGNAYIATKFMERYVNGKPLTSVHKYRVNRLTTSLRSDLQVRYSSNSAKMAFAGLMLKRDVTAHPVFDAMHLSKLELLMKTDCMKKLTAKLKVPDAVVTVPRDLRVMLENARQKKRVDREKMMALGRRKMWGTSSTMPKKRKNGNDLESKGQKRSHFEQNEEEI